MKVRVFRRCNNQKRHDAPKCEPGWADLRGWLVLHTDGLPTLRWSPILALTGPSEVQLPWSRPMLYHKSKPPITILIITIIPWTMSMVLLWWCSHCRSSPALYQWFAAQRSYVHKTCFQENCKDTNVVCPVMWTYDICAFDTNTYYDYYWQNLDTLQWCKQNKHFCRITGNK